LVCGTLKIIIKKIICPAGGVPAALFKNKKKKKNKSKL
jgi:hypothetical protein